MKKAVKSGIVVVICAALILGYYFYLTYRDRGGAQSDMSEQTEAEKIISMDFINKYPSSPREVVKVYNQMLKFYYNESHKDLDEVRKVAAQQRYLLDDELLLNNPDTQYLQGIQSDINEYKSAKRTISNASVCGANEVVYKTVDGRECAYVTCSYFIKEDKSYKTTYQRYVLRRDDDNRWKILVYYIIKED